MKLGILLSCLLLVSVFSYAYADSITFYIDVKQFEKRQDIQTSSEKNSVSTETRKYFTLNLNENIGLTTDGMQNSPSNSIPPKVTIMKIILLSDNIPLTSGLDHKGVIIFAKNNMDRITTLEKLSYPERIRLGGKNILVDDNYLNTNSAIDKIPIVKITSNFLTNLYYEKISYCCINEKIEIVKDITFVDNFLFKNNILKLYQISNTADTGFVNDIHSVSVSSNPTILVLLVLLSSYLLYTYEDIKIKYNKNKILSFSFILILTLSSTLTPFSISQNYWGMAFGEVQSNSTGGLNSTMQNSSSVANLPQNSTIYQNVTVSQNATSQIGNLTSSQSLNGTVTPQTSLPNHVGLSDILTLTVTRANSNGTSLSTLPSNSTSSENSTLNQIPVNNTESVTAINSTLNQIPVNNTESVTAINGTQISSKPPGVIVPNATQSWQFDSVNDTTQVGKAYLVNDTNGNSLQLQGNGYLTDTLNQAKILKNFTISAWVKPDYSQGSSIFTVVSKENEFALTINNNIQPRGIATFGVYDGIKWTTVNSTVQLNETWNQLVSTYNGSSISIYVNGTLQSTTAVKSLVLSDDGHLLPKTPDHLSSDADLVIGAFVNSMRGKDSPLNSFSGLIQKVSFYQPYLNQQQVSQLFSQDLPSFGSPSSDISLSSNTSPTSYDYPVVDGISIVDTVDTWIDSNNLNSTSINVVPEINKTKQSFLITESPEFTFKYISDKEILKISHTIKESHKQSQIGRWNDKEKSITVDIIGPDGNKTNFSPTIKEIRQGKYDIKLSSLHDAKPGLYKIKITMVRNGKTFVTNDQYQWGLVSLNTNKSIYKPGENANFTIVVLDNGGHSVCDANVLMNVVDPNGHISTLSSGNGITPNVQCGLYDAKYVTSSEGNYTVSITAQNPSGITNFNTSFLASNSHPFDVIRTAASKIDPVDNPNSFNVKIDVTSFVNQNGTTIKETIPSVFNVTTDAAVKTIGNSKILTWDKNLIGNKTSVQYSYSVPLVFPQLYALGPVQITYGNQTFTEARPWFVANDPAGNPLLSYGSMKFSANTPNAVTLDSSGNIFAVDKTRKAIYEFNPTGNLVFNFTSTSFSVPYGVAVNSTGFIFVTDSGAKKLLVFTSNGTLKKSLTFTTSGVPGPITIGSNDTIYVIDRSAKTVDKFDPNTTPRANFTGANISTRLVSVAVNSTGFIFASDNSTSRVYLLNGAGTLQKALTLTGGHAPQGIATDSSDNVYFIDSISKLIDKFNPNMTPSTNFTNPAFSTPFSIDADSSGNVYVADTANKQIFKLTSTGNPLLSFNSVVFSANTPNAVTLDSSGNMFAIDKAVKRVYEFNPTGNLVFNFTSTSFSVPYGVAVNSTGFIFVTDSGAKKLLVFTSNGTLKKSLTFTTSGVPGPITIGSNDTIYVIDRSAKTVDKFDPNTTPRANFTGANISTRLVSVAVNSTGFIFASDNSTSRVYLLNGAGTLKKALTLTGGHAPQGIATDSSDNVYFIDSISKLVDRFNPNMTPSKNFTNPAFSTPFSIDADSSGNVYVADTANKQIFKLTSTGNPLLSPTSVFFSANTPNAVTLDSSGNLFAVDKAVKHIYEFNPSGDLVFNFTSTSFSVPYGVAVNSTGFIFVTDSGAKKLLVFTSNGTLKKSLTFTTSGVPGPITIGSNDTIYVIDRSAKTVDKFDPNTTPRANFTGANISTRLVSVAVNSTGFIFASDNSTSRVYLLNGAGTLKKALTLTGGHAPQGIATDSSDNVYFIDSISKLVDRFNPNMTPSTNFTNPAFSTPFSIDADSSGNVYVSDINVKQIFKLTSGLTIQSLSDSIPLSDTLSTSATKSKSLSDSIPLSDTLSTSATKSKSLSDSIPLSDTLSASATKSKSLSDSIPLSDTLSRQASLHTSLSDSIPLSDTLSTSATRSRSFSDSIPLSDTVTARKTTFASLSDSIPLSDTVTARKTTFASLSDSIPLSDTLSTSATRSRSFSDSIPLSDTVTARKTTFASLSDSIPLSDTVTARKTTFASLSDSIPLSDTLSRQASLHTSLSDSIPLSDTVTARKTTFASLSDSIPLSDTVTARKTTFASLSDSIPLSDTLSASATKSKSLSDSIPLSDTLSRQASLHTSLSDSIPLSDTVTARKTTFASLSDSIPLSDTVATIATANSFLSDTIPLSDTLSTSATRTRSFSDTIPLSDSVTSHLTSTQKSLSDSIPLSDTLSTSARKSASLSDSIPLSDSVATIATANSFLSDTIPLSDTLSTSATRTRSFSDTIQLSDTLSTSATKSASLSDSISLSDSVIVQSTKSKSLSNSIPLSDTLSTSATRTRSFSDTISLDDSVTSHLTSTQKSLSDSIPLSDTLSTSARKSASLSDSIPLSDSVNVLSTKNSFLSNSISLSDTLSTSAAMTRSFSDSIPLTDSVTTRLTTTHTSLSDSIPLSDTLSTSARKSASLSDSIPLSDSVNVLSTKNSFLSNSISLSDTLSTSTTRSRSFSDTIPLSDSVTSHLTSTQKSLSDTIPLSDTLSTSATRTRSFSDTIPLSDSVTSLENLAPNQQLVENGQQQITVDPNKPQLVVTSSSAALSNVTIPSTVTTSQLNYTLITSGGSATIDNAVTITKDTNGDNSIEVKVTLPSSTTITGTSWNGLLQLPKVVSSTDLTFPVQSGQVATAGIVIDVGSSTSLTFNQPVRMLFVGQSGKQVGFFHNTNTVTEITATCTSDSVSGMPSGANECKINVGSDMVIWTKHFTGFGTWGSSSSSSGKGAGGTGVGGGGGGGGYGYGYEVPSQYGKTEGEIVANLTSSLKILSISYDTCDTNMAKILVSYSDNNPSVILRSSVTGVVNAAPAKVQPYVIENENATIKKLVYEVPISAKQNSFEVLALQAIGHDIISVGKTVEMTSCQGQMSFEGELVVAPKQIVQNAPRIFDLKFQINNGTKIPSSEDNHSTSPQQVTVSGIVDSKTALDSAELRFVKAGDLASNFVSVKMDVIPIQITNSTYVISGTIPKDAISAPGVFYWIALHNAAGKTESDHYGIGVKPAYQVNGKLELDVRPTRVEGTTDHPTAYFTNTANGPVYGSISLLVDGNVVYHTPAQIFGIGENPVNLQWKSPTIGHVSQHTVQAKVELYGQSFETVSSSITTFPGTANISLDKFENITGIAMGNQTIAKASVLYSSFSNKGSMQFKVTAPDGTCVIGASENCLVTQSTNGHGKIKSVTIGDQIFRIRYSGSDVPLERFSITSVDPIIGNWKVEEVDSKTGLVPMADAMNDVILKVKYNDVDTSRMTILSK